jgi:hypothetical protein
VSKPTQQDETKTRQEYETLFTVEEPGQGMAIKIGPFSIDDSIPDEEEIRKDHSKMKRGKASSGSGITVEFLQSWMRDKEHKNPRLEILAAWLNRFKWHLRKSHYPEHLE